MNKNLLKWLILIAVTAFLTLLTGMLFHILESPRSIPGEDPEALAMMQTEQLNVSTTWANLNQPKYATGPLLVNPDNPRYFTDGTRINGKYRVVYLTGSHTWCNFTDCGHTDPPPVFDYAAFLNFLEAHNHNFFRLWRAENVRGGEGGDDFWFSPMPYQRSASECCAFDGKNKFDLAQFDQDYFNRLRQRVIQAGERGMYVSIMLFDGWSIETKSPSTHQPWKGHPFNLSNNVNNVDGDMNGDGQGGETHTLANPSVTAFQEAYVRKVIDTVNDLDNVLYEISNESSGASKLWQYHMIDFIKAYETDMPKQHSIGMTVAWPNGSNEDLFNSPADWISPNGDLNNPPVANGTKVILADTDHLCGICGDRQWVWKSFTSGENPIFMDYYDNATSGRGIPFENPYQDEIRVNLGYTRSYAERMNMVAMTPLPDLCSTGYCLGNPVAEGAEYLVFLPSGETIANLLTQIGIARNPLIYLPADGNVTVDLSASPIELFVEWFNPENGTKVDAPMVFGGDVQTFSAPFTGDAVLYIYNVVPSFPTPTKKRTPISPTSTQIQTSTLPPATQASATSTSPSPTPDPTTPLPCAQGFLVLSGLSFLMVVWSKSFKRK